MLQMIGDNKAEEYHKNIYVCNEQQEKQNRRQQRRKMQPKPAQWWKKNSVTQTYGLQSIVTSACAVSSLSAQGRIK